MLNASVNACQLASRWLQALWLLHQGAGLAGARAALQAAEQAQAAHRVELRVQRGRWGEYAGVTNQLAQLTPKTGKRGEAVGGHGHVRYIYIMIYLHNIYLITRCIQYIIYITSYNIYVRCMQI